MQVRAFFSRNLVAIVMVPVIIAGHYTWYKLQKMDALVSEHDRRKLPFASLLFGSWSQVLPEFFTTLANEEDIQRYSDQEFLLNFF